MEKYYHHSLLLPQHQNANFRKFIHASILRKGCDTPENKNSIETSVLIPELPDVSSGT